MEMGPTKLAPTESRALGGPGLAAHAPVADGASPCHGRWPGPPRRHARGQLRPAKAGGQCYFTPLRPAMAASSPYQALCAAAVEKEGGGFAIEVST